MLRELVRKEKIDFLAIQETKLEVVSDALCYSIWGSENCHWSFLPSEGNSGGILSIWGKPSSSLIFNFSGEGFVGVCLEWGAHKKVCFIVNVYSKCDIADKRRLWDMLLMSKRGFGGGAWCVIGDFNAVLSRDERRGVTQSHFQSPSLEIVEFEAFVNNMELVDLDVLGRKFTWFHSNGTTMSRIDRALVSNDWISVWGYPSLWVLPRSVSDHCPLVIRYNSVDWGPKPFRFNNHWLSHKDFKVFVEEAWRSMPFVGWMGYILKDKLKALKVKLKEWNKDIYGAVDTKILILVEEIKVLDLRGEEGNLSNADVSLRKNQFSELWHLLKSKEATMVQRSRSRWLREGDANSNYFHSLMNSRGKRNAIRALELENGWTEEPLLIRQEVVRFFKNQFQPTQWCRPQLDGIQFPCLSAAENEGLIRPFSMEEIEAVVNDCDGNKSPGPDDFNFNFVKAFWSIMKVEMRILFDQFHGIASLPKSFLSYFVALIPKVNTPLSLSDFRPISLLGCLYKLVAKVLAKRLGLVMNSIVAPTQSAFLKERYLVDGVMVVNEIVDLAKKTGKGCLVFKVDFEKAYDSVEWSFLEYMLVRFGFCDKWRSWMRACIFAGNMSILVNGSPTEEINIKRGLKQGDPLAPFLFLLVAEGLGGLMKRAVDLNFSMVFK
ncbi:hypothetical protein P8452_73482 [Trifolium repens]|nr:hypothetical protein P8452_73482 [Trifolium repens]